MKRGVILVLLILSMISVYATDLELPLPPKTPVELGEGIVTLFQDNEVIVVEIPKVPEPVVQPVIETPKLESKPVEVPVQQPVVETPSVKSQDNSFTWIISSFLIVVTVLSLFMLNKTKQITPKPQVIQQQVDPTLLSIRNYVFEQMKYGYSKQQISQSMLQHGYSQQTIEEVMKHV